MRTINTGDIVKVHGHTGLFVAGREHRDGKRKVWSYRMGRPSFISLCRLTPTGYNIHTNHPYDIEDVKEA